VHDDGKRKATIVFLDRTRKYDRRAGVDIRGLGICRQGNSKSVSELHANDDAGRTICRRGGKGRETDDRPSITAGGSRQCIIAGKRHGPTCRFVNG